MIFILIRIVSLLELKKAASGFEPEYNGFADRCLTTWPCRLNNEKSGKRDLNPRLQPWQGCTLPLSYSRVLFDKKTIKHIGINVKRNYKIALKNFLK